MKQLEQMGMTIGDFAASLMESGAVTSKVEPKPNPAAPKQVQEAPQKDISDVEVPDNLINSVLSNSFGVPQQTHQVAEERDNTPAPQQQLNERVVVLKEELKDTILKLTGIITEMLEMTGTGAIGVNLAGPQADPFKDEEKKRKKKRGHSKTTK